LKPVLAEFKTWLKFIKFGHSSLNNFISMLLLKLLDNWQLTIKLKLLECRLLKIYCSERIVVSFLTYWLVCIKRTNDTAEPNGPNIFMTAVKIIFFKFKYSQLNSFIKFSLFYQNKFIKKSCFFNNCYLYFYIHPSYTISLCKAENRVDS